MRRRDFITMLGERTADGTLAARAQQPTIRDWCSQDHSYCSAPLDSFSTGLNDTG